MEKDRRSTWSSRRATWQYPPAPTPRILNLPRRYYTKKRSQVHQLPKHDLAESPVCQLTKLNKGKLAVLFQRDRAFATDFDPIVTVIDEPRRPRVDEQERVFLGDHCSFQTELLRAECNRLRTRLKIMERKGIHLQKSINSAIQILVLGKHKLEGDESMVKALEHQILKLEKLKRKVGKGTNESQVQSCIKKAEKGAKESFLERMKAKSEKCAGCCRVMANRVMEQVKAESEQWWQMKQMVEEVKSQISKLQRARDYWEYRTLQSRSQLKAIRSSAQAWKNAALENELKLKELQMEVKMLKADKAATSEAKQRHPLADITNTNYFTLRESLYHHRPLR